MVFVCKMHQHKAYAYLMALKRAGHMPMYNISKADFVLIDWPREPAMSEVAKHKKPLFMYPHSVRPNNPWDICDDGFPNPRAFFTISEGHKEVMKRCGRTFPIEVTGWTYTNIRPFQPAKTGNKIRVLFAPIHPIGNGHLPDIDREDNANVFKLLLSMMKNIELTVRHIFALTYNGLWVDPRVKYIASAPNGSTDDMRFADVIIASFTYAHMAVALGKPLIMMGEEIMPHNTPTHGELMWAKNWEAYHEYMKFPYNIEDVLGEPVDALDMMNTVMVNEPTDWKSLFIGQPFNGKQFVNMLESYL